MKNFNSRLNQLEEILNKGDDNKVFIFDLTLNPPILSYNKTDILLKAEYKFYNEEALQQFLIDKGLMKKGEQKLLVVMKELK